ncbi:hypothetical protein PYW08_004923 [Mythimna loreyi]|uniref:Uncharacterized protein n=1 Tax=Mythimna loreyi TaxID=667449 RepID=A0ACC2QG87_9NEOP|nr:hypothetical protein PYW08_004923 [Mythimna loreyi]
MVIKVGINGFGRIGRVIFRTCLQNPDLELTAINDPAIDIEYICYLIKFDSTHGKFQGNITHTEHEVNIDGRLIKVFRDKLPHTVPWQMAGVQYVIEASGMFTCLEKSSGHLASDGVKRVIVTAPSADIPMIILGVNDNKLNAEQKILSCASSTLYCLAPIIKVLEENYGVTEGFITSIHAMTPSLKPLDGLCLRGKHWRDHRSIHQNIIPATTGSCKALAKIIPQVKDKMAGLAFRVPIVNVSVLDMTVRLDANTNLQHIVNTVEDAGRTYLRNIIKISNDEAVSSDFSRDSHSCILDADSSLELKPNFYKIICWYENEYSYACRVLDSIFFSERQFNKPVKLPCKMTYVRAKLSKKQDEVQQTERGSKDATTIECNTEIPKCCTSVQETTCKRKPILRPVVLRKPLSSYGSANSAATAPVISRDTKKGNELFKIWNDNNDAQKTAARQNRSSFFQSCMAFGPKPTDNTEGMKSQETLETVKREFSKMVHITEDLLKKSNASKFQLGPATKSSLEGVKLGSSGASMESKTEIAPLNNPTANNSLFGICGDYKILLSTTSADCSKEEVRHSCLTQQNDNNSDSIITNAVKKVVLSNKPVLIPSREILSRFAKQNSVMNFCPKATVQNNSTIKANDSPKKVNSKFMNTTIGSKGQMKKIDNLFMDNLSKEPIVQFIVEEQEETTPKISSNAVSDCVKEQQEVKITESIKPPQVTTDKKGRNNQKAFPTVEKPYKEFDKYLHKKDYNIRIIDEELQKRNIVLVNNEKPNVSEASSESCNVISDKSNVETDVRRKILNKPNLDSLSRKVSGPAVLVPEESSRYSPSAATTVCNANTRNKPDLYDKLDSTSATDSTNSFEINERKSQVIQICDLTNSLEDLSRLDKICRIIEISDELSDKLFSSLDQSELTGLQQKKWSFRDLCERIQLDDFCNNVFGKTRS